MVFYCHTVLQVSHIIPHKTHSHSHTGGCSGIWIATTFDVFFGSLLLMLWMLKKPMTLRFKGKIRPQTLPHCHQSVIFRTYFIMKGWHLFIFLVPFPTFSWAVTALPKNPTHLYLQKYSYFCLFKLTSLNLRHHVEAHCVRSTSTYNIVSLSPERSSARAALSVTLMPIDWGSCPHGAARANWLLTHPCNKALPPSVPRINMAAPHHSSAPPQIGSPCADLPENLSSHRLSPGLFLQLMHNLKATEKLPHFFCLYSRPSEYMIHLWNLLLASPATMTYYSHYRSGVELLALKLH